MRILIVEDDKEIAENIRLLLDQTGYLADVCFCAEDGLERLYSEDYDLAILDWKLPGLQGIDLCRKIREEKINLPVLMLSAKSRLEDRVGGLDSGADDYLTKPFEAKELISRVKALLRRSQKAGKNPLITIFDLTIDTNACKATRQNHEIALSPKEYELLEYLARNKGQVINRLDLLNHVWGESIDPFSNTVDVHIHHLRQKIDAGYSPKLLKTIRGKGYLLCEE